jgi:hypothetical protein
VTGVAETNPWGVAIIPGGGSFVFGLNVDEPFIGFVGLVVKLVDGAAVVVVLGVDDVGSRLIDNDDDGGKTTPGGIGKAVMIDGGSCC